MPRKLLRAHWSQKKRKEWESKYLNYLSTFIGVNGVPLSYVVWEKYNPYENGDSTNFIYKTIACAPLEGNYYESDSDTVHQSLVLFTIGQKSEDWIKDNLRYRDERHESIKESLVWKR